MPLDSNPAQKAETNVDINPLDVGAEPLEADGSDVLKNIVTTETKGEEARIIEEAPDVDISLLRDIEPPRSILLLLLKILFGGLVSASFASIIFFTSQLTDKFDFASSTFGVPNVSKELSSSNSEIIKLQTSLNFYRYLQLKSFLDEFSYYGDSYVQNFEIANSQTAEKSDISDAAEMMKSLKEYLKDSFVKINEILADNFSAPLVSKDYETDPQLDAMFQTELISKLNERANELSNSSDPQANRDYKNYVHTVKLIGNVTLRNLVINTDFDALTDEMLYDLIKKINSVIVNDLSIIQKIKDKRIKWSDLMNEIELRTIAVDSYYSGSFYDEIGGIRYTSYDLDSSGPTISITGETKRFDTTNFTMIANLIDELNRSDLFENAEMKSFSKSGSIESGYTASLKLDLDLEKGGSTATEPSQTNPPIDTENDLLVPLELTL